MNGKVHYWIVCDAVRYIKDHGNSFEKKSLQVLQNAYGKNIPVQNIPYYDGAVQKVAGFESWYTDKYHDLALYLESLLGGWKDDITEYDGHIFTALNHFINVFIVSPVMWWGHNGYYYFWSSKKSSDADAMTGWVDYLDAEVDNENSLILDRIKAFWKGGNWSWGDNFEWDIRYTMFAPVSALAHFYYSRLVLSHFVPLKVDGPHKYVAGLQLLGPVLHAIADSCVPQHVRPAMGFRHQDWENYVESQVWAWEIDLDSNLVSKFLSQKPFHPWYIWTGGPLKGKFADEWVISRIAEKARDRLSWSTGMSYTQLWQAGEGFWNGYMLGNKLFDDAKYLYNLAVAGTVHAIVRAYADLVDEGILSSNPGLINPERIPDLEVIKLSLKELPLKKPEEGGTPPELQRSIPFSEAKGLLGYEPTETEREQLDQLLQSANRIFDVDRTEKLEPERVLESVLGIEDSLTRQYINMQRRLGAKFCPLRHMEETPYDSELSAHFGTGTYRLPSLEECDTPELFQQYMNRLDVHTYKAHIFELTKAIASLKFYSRKFREEDVTNLHIQEIARKIERLRGQTINERTILEVEAGESMIEQFDIVEVRPEGEEVETIPPRTE